MGNQENKKLPKGKIYVSYVHSLTFSIAEIKAETSLSTPKKMYNRVFIYFLSLVSSMLEKKHYLSVMVWVLPTKIILKFPRKQNLSYYAWNHR